MNTQTPSSKTDLLSTEEWQDLYIRAESWQSDFDFHQDELKFFKHIIDKYFIHLISDTKLADVQRMITDIDVKNGELAKLNGDCTKLFKGIGAFMGLSTPHNEDLLLEEFNSLDQSNKDFEVSLRTLKKRVFETTEHMMKSEKLKFLVGA